MSADRINQPACIDPMCACRGGPCAECPEGRVIAAQASFDLDLYLDAILRASGSGLKHYAMQKTRSDMREALRQAIYALDGVKPCHSVQTDYELLTDALAAIEYYRSGPEFAIYDRKLIERLKNAIAASHPAHVVQADSEDAAHAVKYCWSLSEDELFTGRHDSIESALAEAQDDLEGNYEPGDKATVYVGESMPALSYLTPVWIGDWVIEHIDEYLADNHIAADDVILETDKAGKQALGRLVIELLEANIKPHRYGVENIKPHEVTVGDYAARAQPAQSGSK